MKPLCPRHKRLKREGRLQAAKHWLDDGDDEEEILKAVSLIHTYIRNNSDRHGFVNYRDTDNAVYGAELVLEKAETAVDENNVVHAVNLALCVVREMVDLIQNADDSSGTIGGVQG